MAINAFACDKLTPKSSKGSESNTCRLIKINFGPDEIIATANKRGKLRKVRDVRSPYVGSDKVQLLSRITERKIVHKKPEFKNSFPLAANLYKASSDEFKTVKRSYRKVKKSVLTLPNEPIPMLQTCTVSDVNDSEYCKRKDDEIKPPKKRLLSQNRKVRGRNKDFEFYDRDARHCSQLSIDLDSSSNDMIKRFGGDGKRVSRISHAVKKPQTKVDFKPHDVWTMLKNMNRFQFKPSPPMSEESIATPKRKKAKRRRNRTERRLIETCRTEEIAYIANFEVDTKSQSSVSPSTSLDRITVINKNELGKKLDIKITKPQNLINVKNGPRTPNRIFEKPLLKSGPRNNFKVSGLKDKHIIPNRNGYEQNVKLHINKGKPDQSSEKDVNHKSKGSCSSLFRDSHDSSNYERHIRNTDERTYIIKAKDNKRCTDESGERFISSASSAANKTAQSFLKEKDKSPRGYADHHINGLTKVVLNKRDGVVSNRFDSLKRKPRLVTTMPSAAVMPKLTTADIKRRLAHMKFPLVILGKDQVSSTVEVLDFEPPQFNGLKKHIWPFMVEWRNGNLIEQTNQSTAKVINDSIINRIRSPVNKPKDKRIFNDTNKKKMEHKRGIHNVESISQPPKKNKPMHQLKDKMLKLLYKKSSHIFDGQVNNIQLKVVDETKTCNVAVAKTDACTETNDQLELVPNVPINITNNRNLPKSLATLYKRPNLNTVPMNQKIFNQRRPWCKAKWASEFIDNVIEKIKNGAYYSHEDNNCQLNQISVSNVVGLQESHKDIGNEFNEYYDQCLDLIPSITITNKYDPLKAIPGFDDSLPDLEIKTMNLNQIAVKHCLTNVVVQFDVTVPEEHEIRAGNLKQTFPCMPNAVTDSCITLNDTESHTKIFKCKTTILNAILPAELCSVLPKILRKFIDTNRNLTASQITTVSPMVEKTDSYLSTITETSRCGSPSSIKAVMLPICASPELRMYQDGWFSSRILIRFSMQKSIERVMNAVRYNRLYIREILPEVTVKPLFRCVLDPVNFLLLKTNGTKSSISLRQSDAQLPSGRQMFSCTTLQLYTRPNERLTPNVPTLAFMRILENLRKCHEFFNLNIPSSIHTVKLTCDVNNVTVNMTGENQGLNKTITVTLSKLKIDSLFNGLAKRNAFDNKNVSEITEIDSVPVKSIEHNRDSRKITKKNFLQNVGCTNKTKRKGFVLLYKKCKSTSNISGERCCTPLNKISNLDDFFQALGSGKMLSSVFDTNAEQRILSSLTEMKSWIIDITPRQAMLVLLLTNKKNTPNLVRYRPVLLQGIAVNRITRVTELDMEIEVIERENLNKLSQYEGISYLPSSAENNDNLLEELYWIAKTTASDYQRPFDESSEKLLKSLLAKRKKLNPSYLRVMARYVGLGLLKSQNK